MSKEMMVCAMLSMAFLLAPAAASPLGPGRGAWVSGQPEAHNLTMMELEQAARQLQSEAPVKECFAVAKEGKLLYEIDFRTAPDQRGKKIESDSAGKTITALLIGRLVTMYNVSLDSTLESHGVRPQADWGPGNTYFPHVTIRHVLGQVAGSGQYPPGAAFTYDSGDYLQHLSALIETVSKQAPKTFAKEHFAIPLGIPELYANDSYTAIEPADDGNITAGGSQFVSCVQMLRFGQLILNRGVWPDADGNPQQLIDVEYIKQLLTPQHPEVIQNYGLLTWLTNEGPLTSQSAGATVGCCQPQWLCFGHKHVEAGGNISITDGGRWGALMPGETILSEAQLQVAGLPKPRPGLALAMGWLDKHMLVDQFSNTTIVSFGQTLGATKLCGERYSPNDVGRMGSTSSSGGNGISTGRWVVGVDGTFTASLMWKAVHMLLPRDSYSYDINERSINTNGHDSHAASIAQKTTIAPRKYYGNSVPQRMQRVRQDARGGSCVCYCPPQQGFGGCARVDSPSECSVSKIRPKGVCPAIGMVMQCVSTADGNTSQVGCDVGFDMGTSIGNCTTVGNQGCGKGHSPFDAMRCSCMPTAFEWCGYNPAPCPKDDPFFPNV